MIQAKRHSFLMTFRKHTFKKRQSNSVKPAATFISNDSPQETFSLEARHCKNIYSSHLIRLLFHRAEAIKRECSQGPNTTNLLTQLYVWLLLFLVFCYYFSSVQFSSVAESCLTLCDAMNRSTPGLPVHYQLPEFTQTHVHRVSDAIQPSHLLSSPSSPPPVPPSIRVFSNESTLRMRWPRYWSFSFNISPYNEHPGLISFKMDWLDLIAVQGRSRVFSNSKVQKHQFFGAQLSSQSNSHIHTWPLEKNIALTRQTFVGKVMSLLLNMLSRLVITFLPRSKRLLISWLKSPSAVILEPQKIVWHCFHCFSIYFWWSDGTRCHDLCFLNVEL